MIFSSCRPRVLYPRLFNYQETPEASCVLEADCSGSECSGDEWNRHVHTAKLWYACPMRTRSLNHSAYQIQYHLVFGTKYRRRYLKSYVVKELKRSFYQTVKDYPTLWIEKLATDEDHLHMQIEIPPNMTISAAVQALKARSSIDLKKQFPFIRKMYIDGSIWSVGFYVSTIGLNEKMIKRYLDMQGRLDRGKTLRLGFS